MKKIKEYINNKPKLKKTIKVFGVLLFILSIGFNVLIISVASCSNSKIEKDIIQNEVFVTTPIYNALDYNNSAGDTLHLFSPSDIASTNTLLGIVDFVKQYDENFDPFTEFASPWSSFFSVPTYYSIQWSQLRPKIEDNTLYSTAFDNLYSSNDKQDQFYISFSYFPTYSYWEVRLALNTNNMEHQVYWSYTLGSLNVPSCNTTSLNQGCVILDRTSTGLYYILNYDSRKGNFYDEGYRDGYNTGYTNGFNEGNTSITSPFNLISKAFTSIASILNIQIIPNLTLGVLLFAPLVIIIIIAIFKIFRG